ncbi:MAG: hypothetical protein FJ020_09055 [Chloroflexi bacterium]|nr:hypothetical protein [Chloroflexota bacterium]
MLFMTYFELGDGMPERQRLKIAEKVVSSGKFPPKGVSVIRWDITPDGWGVGLFEAGTAEDAMRIVNIWRAAAPGFFRCTKTAPAMPVEDDMSISVGLVRALAQRRPSRPKAG